MIQGLGGRMRRHRSIRFGRETRKGASLLVPLFLVLGAFAAASAPVGAAGPSTRAVSATPAPIGVFPGSAAARSVLNFERSLGRPVDYGHDYIHKRSWATITDVAWQAHRWTSAGFAGRTVFTLPMLPDRGGSLKLGARGAYNAKFRLIAKRLVAGGQGAAVLRIAPEFNGDWFRWTIKGTGNATRYKLYWRKIVTTMRSVPGAKFRFDWSPNSGSSWVGKRRLRAANAYPGDRYVDFIGLDIFDQSWAPHAKTASRRWNEFMTQTDGLAWHARFAAAHRKPMTFPEWGLVKRRDGRGGGDNPYFVRQMYTWIQTHPVAYHLYFESRDPNGEYRVFSGKFPKAAQSFVRYFGGKGAA